MLPRVFVLFALAFASAHAARTFLPEDLVRYYAEVDPSKANRPNCEQVLREYDVAEVVTGLSAKYGRSPLDFATGPEIAAANAQSAGSGTCAADDAACHAAAAPPPTWGAPVMASGHAYTLADLDTHVLSRPHNGADFDAAPSLEQARLEVAALRALLPAMQQKASAAAAARAVAEQVAEAAQASEAERARAQRAAQVAAASLEEQARRAAGHTCRFDCRAPDPAPSSLDQDGGTPLLGSQANPAASCEALMDAGLAGRSGAYYVSSYDGPAPAATAAAAAVADSDAGAGAGAASPPVLVHCDLQREGGGWTLLMKAGGAAAGGAVGGGGGGGAFPFDSHHWTDGSSTLNAHDVSELGATEAKFGAFNSLRAREFMAVWLPATRTEAEAEAGAAAATPEFTWRIGPLHPATTALALFGGNSSRVLQRAPDRQPGFKRGVFSLQSGIEGGGTLALAHAAPAAGGGGGGGARWGYTFAHGGGNVAALGGIGLGVAGHGGRSVGDFCHGCSEPSAHSASASRAARAAAGEVVDSGGGGGSNGNGGGAADAQWSSPMRVLLFGRTAAARAAEAAAAEQSGAQAAFEQDAEAMRQKAEQERRNAEAQAGGGPAPYVCAQPLSCGTCLEKGCAWCLASRKCVQDKPWICQGDVDHVSPPGGTVGKAPGCPDIAAIRGAQKARREKVARAAAREAAEAERRRPGAAPETAAQELERRYEFSLEEDGAQRPYEVLGLEKTADVKAVKRAYRKLSVRFHPDKWPKEPHNARAKTVFADLAAAHKTLTKGDGTGEAKDGNAGGGSAREEIIDDFYKGDENVVPLTEKLWEKSLRGDAVWLVEFYAPWCGGCKSFKPQYTKIAAQMAAEDNSIHVGAVNCEKQKEVCTWFNLKKYPTVFLVNRKHGMRQEYKGKHDITEDTNKAIIKWASAISAEWRWLMEQASVARIPTEPAAFEATVLRSTDFWVVLFTDGTECGPCKTAMTNIMRLAAGLEGAARVGVVNCEEEEAQALCYEHQKIPGAPHAPVLKAYRAGEKLTADGRGALGEIMYNGNTVEPHLALELIERTVRLARADTVAEEEAKKQETALQHQRDADPEKEKEEEKPERPQPQWDGPDVPQNARPWDGPTAPEHLLIGSE